MGQRCFLEMPQMSQGLICEKLRTNQIYTIYYSYLYTIPCRLILIHRPICGVSSTKLQETFPHCHHWKAVAIFFPSIVEWKLVPILVLICTRNAVRSDTGSGNIVTMELHVIKMRTNSRKMISVLRATINNTTLVTQKNLSSTYDLYQPEKKRIAKQKYTTE